MTVGISRKGNVSDGVLTLRRASRTGAFLKYHGKRRRQKLFFVNHIPDIFHLRLDAFVAGNETGDFVFGVHNGGVVATAHYGADGRERKRKKFGNKIDTDPPYWVLLVLRRVEGRFR